MNEQRLETIELSLTELKVLQSRGISNKITKYHQQIIKLVENNIPLIQEKLAA
ncbi:PcfJ domain-containing protein [Dysgonomonas sp. GY75]|uniref:PcfJ domain-containing protein n=1 Tax=Dysgonomonas sp. GY75 TaxID=2780419 RepID=UPI003977BE0C